MNTIHAYMIPADDSLARGAVALAHGMVSIDTPALVREAAYNVGTFGDRKGKPVEQKDGTTRVPVTTAEAQAWGWIRSALKSSPCDAGRILRAASDGDGYARMVSRNAGKAARIMLGEGRTIGYRLPDGSVLCVGIALASKGEVARIASKPANVQRATAPYRQVIAAPREVLEIAA